MFYFPFKILQWERSAILAVIFYKLGNNALLRPIDLHTASGMPVSRFGRSPLKCENNKFSMNFDLLGIIQ